MRDIYIHHSGGRAYNPYASSVALTAHDINLAHKERWNFRSSLGYYGGYNVYYEPLTRKFTQFRALGEETAAQRGYNHEFSLCIGGNYSKTPIGAPAGSIDELTEQTRQDIAEFLYDLLNGNKRNLIVAPNTKVELSIARIYPHRAVAQTECYGTALSDRIIKDDLINLYGGKLKLFKKLLELYSLALSLLQKKGLAGQDRECEGYI